MPNSELQLFQFNTSPVRTVTIDGEPWFVAKDVSDTLEFRDPANAFRSLEDSEKGTHIVCTLGETQSIQELESSAKGGCKAPTLGTTQSIQRPEDLEKGTHNVSTLGGDQSMTIVSESGTEDTT